MPPADKLPARAEMHRFIFALEAGKFQRLKANAKSEGRNVKDVLTQLIDGYLAEKEGAAATLAERVDALEERLTRLETSLVDEDD